MTRKKTPYVADNHGHLFVRAASIMNPLCAVIDGLAVTFFGSEKIMYIGIEIAIEWCRKEAESHDRKQYEKIIAALESANEKFKAGKMIEQ